MQAELPSSGTLKLYAYALGTLSDKQITQSLSRAASGDVQTYGKFPTVKQFFDLAGVIGAEAQADAEAIVAWEALLDYVRLGVVRDLEGNWGTRPAIKRIKRDADGSPIFVPHTRKRLDGSEYVVQEVASEDVPIPGLTDRAVAVVRMMGGWGIFAQADDSNMPFVRRDFLGYYKQQPAVEQAKLSGNTDHQKALESKVKAIGEGKAMS